MNCISKIKIKVTFDVMSYQLSINAEETSSINYKNQSLHLALAEIKINCNALSVISQINPLQV